MTPLEQAKTEEPTLSDDSTSPTPMVIQRKIAFDLPFVVMVEDNLGDGIIQNHWRTERKFNQTTVDKAKPLALDSSSSHNSFLQTPLAAPPYVVNTKYGVVKITMLKVNSSEAEDWLLNLEFQGSVSKALAFTTVLVEFAPHTYGMSNLNPEVFRDLTQEAVYGFNYFLTHYRILANRLYVPPVTPQSITKFYMLDLLDNGTISSVVSTRYWANKAIPIERVIPKEIDAQLKVLCINGENIDAHSLLVNETWTRLTLMEWRMAVISGVITFESWLSIELRKFYKLNGVEEKDLKWKFMTDEPKKDDRKNLGIIEIAEKLLLDTIGFDFKATPEFKAVKEKSIILRNSIIHRGKLDVTQKEAYDSVHAVMDAINIIITHSTPFLQSKGIPVQHSVFNTSSK